MKTRGVKGLNRNGVVSDRTWLFIRGFLRLFHVVVGGASPRRSRLVTSFGSNVNWSPGQESPVMGLVAIFRPLNEEKFDEGT